MGSDVYPYVDRAVHLPGRGPLHHHLRRHSSQGASQIVCDMKKLVVLPLDQRVLYISIRYVYKI